MKKRNGFTLLELLVIIAIIGVMIAMLLPAIQRVRESAKRATCANNLRSLGQAVHGYHDSHLEFPREGEFGWTGQTSFYVKLLPYVEEGRNAGTEPVAIFLCPSRRDVSVGPKDDFAAPLTINATEAALLTNKTSVDLPTLGNADGTATTMLLSHKAMHPSHYQGGGPAFMDTAYAEIGDGDHVRGWKEPNRDASALKEIDGHIVLGLHFSTPHGTIVPSLFADASVHNYRWGGQTWKALWTWKGGENVAAP